MGHFHEELCGCFSDIKSCLWVWCVPGGVCCVQAVATDRATQSGAFVPCILVALLGPIGAAINRGKIRERYGIEGSFVGDCCTWMWCAACAACQEYRETQRR